MGWPPCGKTMVHWFSTRERGLTVSVWNTAHNVGGALVATLRVRRRAAVPRLACEVLLQRADRRDRSRGCLLPAAGHAAVTRPAADREVQERLSARLRARGSERILSFREIFFSYVLPNRYLWAIATANVFCYFVRYGVENWIPTYLQTHQGVLVQGVERGVVAVRVCGDSRHDRLRLGIGPLVPAQARAGDDAVHGADAAWRSWSTGSTAKRSAAGSTMRR